MATTIRLTVVTGPHRGERFCFRGAPTCVVGRSTDCFMCLSGDHRDQSISRRHCLMQIDPPLIEAHDLGSTNGTYINGHSIDEVAEDRPPACHSDINSARLQAGDIVTVGGTSFRVDVVECPPTLPGVEPEELWAEDEIAKAHCAVACQ